MLLPLLFDQLSDYIAAAAGLGTTAYALVDGSKAFWGGVSNCGFGAIEREVKRFFPDDIRHQASDEPLSLVMVVGTLRANWLNGTTLADQMAIAKSLIKLRLNEATAAYLAKATGVDEQGLVIIAEKIASGETLTPDENDLYGRFDLLLTALLDKGYQRADQIYRNSAKAWSIVVSVVLAIVGVWVVYGSFEHIGGAILVGLAATPIAPVAKDLTSALSAGVKVAQALRK
ncbi:MAG: hypothetical protein PHY16_19805 [Methylobacter sp.]|nr:hypothetical protein [Methylobacter sp.]